jgi:hypothetical protein
MKNCCFLSFYTLNFSFRSIVRITSFGGVRRADGVGSEFRQSKSFHYLCSRVIVKEAFPPCVNSLPTPKALRMSGGDVVGLEEKFSEIKQKHDFDVT